MSDDEFAPIAGTYPPVIRLYASLFPELSRFADRSERRVAWRRATSEATSRPSFWLAALVLIALDATVVFSLPPLGVPISQRANVRLLSLIVVMGALFVLMWLCRRSIQRCLRRQLNEIGTPTCVGCGYDLSHPASDKCPECGWPVLP